MQLLIGRGSSMQLFQARCTLDLVAGAAGGSVWMLTMKQESRKA